MLNAINDAGLNPKDIEYINAHGTSTPLNDKSETLAIKYAFRRIQFNSNGELPLLMFFS